MREGDDGLRGPGGAGLAVAGEGIDTEDSFDVDSAGAFAADEFGDAVEEAGIGEIFGGSGMDGMKIGMEGDVVFFEGGDDISAASLFEDAGFFAYDFEGGADVASGEEIGEAFIGVIVGGEEVVFGVEPEDDIDARRGFIGGAG